MLRCSQHSRRLPDLASRLDSEGLEELEGRTSQEQGTHRIPLRAPRPARSLRTKGASRLPPSPPQPNLSPAPSLTPTPTGPPRVRQGALRGAGERGRRPSREHRRDAPRAARARLARPPPRPRRRARRRPGARPLCRSRARGRRAAGGEGGVCGELEEAV